MRYEHEERAALRLAGDTSAHTVSEECRRAALAFVNGFGRTTTRSWDPLDLVFWLTGPYARATRHAVASAVGAADASVLALEPVREVVEATQGALVELLARASYDDGAPTFVDGAVRRGLVRKTVDADGMVVWVPVARTEMRLPERVESLFAADYLNAPNAYQELTVCRTCRSVLFDDGARRLRQCAAHRRKSGMFERGPTPEPRRRGPGIAQTRPSSTTLRAAESSMR